MPSNVCMAFTVFPDLSYCNMHGKFIFRSFLESSTIHGLVYISTESKFARLFWILVVSTGFLLASYLIDDAFVNWEESPIKTTIETRPISEITFPKVTVCPPKNSFTDLNYDIVSQENVTLTEEDRQDIFQLALNRHYDDHVQRIVRNMSKLEEDNRFYNWYHGYTKIRLPIWMEYYDEWTLKFYTETSATSGTLRTQYFGDQFMSDKIERALICKIWIYPPAHVVQNPEYTLTLKIERVVMTVSGDSKDSFYLPGVGDLDSSQTILTQEYKAPFSNIFITVERYVNQDDIDSNRNLEKMPGFKMSWSYNINVDPDAKFFEHYLNSELRR